MLGEGLIFETLHDAITASSADRDLNDPKGAKTLAQK
jgi:hypothetical protein